MFIQNYGKIGIVEFVTKEIMDTAQAKEYAMQKLKNGNYKGCKIGKVYVNKKLVLENVEIS